MKKYAILASLLIATSVASATALTGTVKYDYDRVESGAFLAAHQGSVGLKFNAGKLGSIDGSVVGAQLVTSDRVNGTGYDVGYSNGVKLGKLGLSARVGFKRLAFDSSKAHTSVREYSTEATYPITPVAVGFLGFEQLRASSDTAGVSSVGIANRASVGFEAPLYTNTTLRVGYVRTFTEGRASNGATVGLKFNF
jgi:hypothetical protein